MATSLPLTEQPQPAANNAIAPVWHTLLIAGLMLGVSFFGASQDKHSLTHGQRVGMYLLTMAVEWIIVVFVFWSVRRHNRITIGELIGGRWRKPEDLLLDLALGAGFLLVSMIVLGLLGLALGLGHQASDAQKLSFMAPRGTLELVLWICVSSTAGFCEEVIFRGYFQRQIAAWTNFAWLGLVGQGILFGFSHGYEGPKRMLLIAIFGMMFGVVALWRKSLRPGMFTHAGYDTIAGIALRVLTK